MIRMMSTVMITAMVTVGLLASPASAGGKKRAPAGQNQAQAQAQAQQQRLNSDVRVVNVDDDDGDGARVGSVSLTSGNCIGSIGGSGAAQPIGITLGGTFTYEDCMANEYAKTLVALGNTAGALAVLCTIERVGENVAECKGAQTAQASASAKIKDNCAYDPADPYFEERSVCK